MPSTTNHGLPYPEGTDSAVVPEDLQQSMEAVDAALDDIKLGQITGVTAGRLLIANGSGVVTGVAMSGDATISTGGVLSIGEAKIDASHLKSNAVTAQKIQDGAINSRAKLGTWFQVANTSGVSGSSGTTTVTWPTAFANSSYTVLLTPFSILQFDVRLTCVNRTNSQITVAYNAAGSNPFTIFALGIA